MVFNHMAGILQNGEPGIVVLSQTSPASPGQQLGPHKLFSGQISRLVRITADYGSPRVIAVFGVEE